MTPAKLPALTEDERSLLRLLADSRPSRDIPAPVRGRLSLYGLISETPGGWIITPLGREAIERAPLKEDTAAPDHPRESPRSPATGNRLPNRRRSPFET